MSTIKINVKLSAGDTFEVEIDNKQTVKQLKEHCVEKSSLAVSDQRLIFKGKFTQVSNYVQ